MKKRNYGIDFLRIVLMFIVITMHTFGHGGVINATRLMSGQYWAGWFCAVSMYFAGNSFVLTSGYLMYKSRIKTSRMAELWLQTAFFTILFLIVQFIVSPETTGMSEVLDGFFPVSRKLYWYVTAYFGLWILSPVLNLAIDKLERRTLEKTLVLTFVFMGVMPFLMQKDPYDTMGGYSVFWSCLVYLAGGYIRKYEIGQNMKKRSLAIILVSMLLINILLKYGIEKIQVITGNFFYGVFTVNFTTPTCIVAAICTLILCSKLEFPNFGKKTIAFLAPTALGIYIIHTHPFIYKMFENYAVSFAEYNPFVMCLLTFLSSTAIWAVCVVVDYIRILLFKLLHVRELCLKVETVFDTKFNAILDKFSS